MQQRISTQDRWALFFERLVWNAAAGAALAVMILVLLGSLRWLDAVSARPDVAGAAAVEVEPAMPPVAAAGAKGPSG